MGGNCGRKERTQDPLRAVSSSWSPGWGVLRRTAAMPTFSWDFDIAENCPPVPWTNGQRPGIWGILCVCHRECLFLGWWHTKQTKAIRTVTGRMLNQCFRDSEVRRGSEHGILPTGNHQRPREEHWVFWRLWCGPAQTLPTLHPTSNLHTCL